MTTEEMLFEFGKQVRDSPSMSDLELARLVSSFLENAAYKTCNNKIHAYGPEYCTKETDHTGECE